MDAGTIQTFDPSSDAASFRDALGTFVTGPVAIVANSFASVSLAPPMVLWSPAKSSKRFEHFAGARRFAVHVLSADQRDICTAIIASKTAISKVPMHLSHCGMPIIEGALATFECNLEATHDAGDHVIVVGEVIRMACDESAPKPILYYRGQYAEIADS